MRANIVPGSVFPDYAGQRRKLSDLQGPDPMILVLSRGGFCPKDRRQSERIGHSYRMRDGRRKRISISLSTPIRLTIQ